MFFQKSSCFTIGDSSESEDDDDIINIDLNQSKNQETQTETDRCGQIESVTKNTYDGPTRSVEECVEIFKKVSFSRFFLKFCSDYFKTP